MNNSDSMYNITLDDSFLFQNMQTGQASSTPLTTRQLCRLLGSSNPPAHLTPDTNLLRIHVDGTYDEEWKPANQVPIIQQAIAQWYYEMDGTTNGPISCQQLAELYHRSRINLSTLVYSKCTDGCWENVSNVYHLQLAIEAFYNIPTSQGEKLTRDGVQKDSKEVQSELEAFLESTKHLGTNQEEDEDDEGYESDGGTKYVKDHRTGRWIHEALVPQKVTPKASTTSTIATMQNSITDTENNGKKRNKAKFSNRNAKCWIYINGLPEDCTIEELDKFCSKAGIIDLDPDTLKPKIKLYLHKEGPAIGKAKGDASVCFAREESVDLALTLLDDAPFRPSVKGDQQQYTLKVERAKFEKHGEKIDKRQKVSQAKRKVAKLAAIQKVDWDEGEINGRLTGGRKGLRIIVLKNMFDPSHFTTEQDETSILSNLEKDLHAECERFGEVEKITVFSRRGVVLVKFTQPKAATEAVKALHGRMWKEVGHIEACFWDGVTDYTARDDPKVQAEMEKRHEEFGHWLDHQELPDDLKLQTEES